MSRLSPLLIALALVACGEDIATTKTPGDTANDTSPADVPDTTQPFDTALPDTQPVDTDPNDPNVSPLTGVNTNVQVTPVTPNPLCDPSQVDLGPHGATYPWGGLTVAGKRYTCNRCPTGLRDFQGRWRAHGWDSAGDPDYALGMTAGPDDAETLFVDGNTFYSRIYDRQDDASVEVRGWFFCGQKPEQSDEHLFWVVLEASPPGTFGFSPGTIFETDVILSAFNDNKLITYLDDIGAPTSVDIGYCRIDTTRAGQVCNDPFAP